MKAQTITIIGLGRTGASVGLALKAAPLDVTIIGHDRSREVMNAAKEKGAVDETQWRLVPAASAADILIIALPASEVEATLQTIGEDVQEHTLILDLSGLKGPSLEWADRYLQRGHYVGAAAVLRADALANGTPGVAGAQADLFKDSIFCLMPSVQAEPKAVETAVNLGAILGAKPFFLDAAEYDSLVVGVETVPGLLAAALFRAIKESTGWRDILRFANLPFAQATMPLRDDTTIALLALQNQTAALRWLEAVQESLKEMHRWVAEGDLESLTALLQQLNLERAKWLNSRATNEWQEIPQQDYKPLGLMEQMLGRRKGTDT